MRLDRPRMRVLLAFLLLHPNEIVASDRLIEEIWGAEPPKTATASLQNYISRLRKLLGTEVVATTPPGYTLRVDPEQVDLHRFERLVQAATSGPSPEKRARMLTAALALWRGPAFADFIYESFAQSEIARLEELRLRAVEARIEAELEAGAAADLVSELQSLVAQHPLREQLHKNLMLALYRSGRQAEALETYRAARRVLLADLGLEPSIELQQLERAILTQDPAIARPFSEDAAQKLPLSPTPLVGRERELSDLLALLHNGRRIVTVTGAGGSGKTRLALQAAAEVSHSFTNGVYWIPLAALHDPALVVPEIAQRLGARGNPSLHLRERETLLLLDNFEHVLAAATAVSDLLREAENVKALVTSRAPLRIEGEDEYALGPLAEPAAAMLFVDRAREVGTEIEPDETVQEICRRVDYLPLAVELAAARTRLLEPRVLLARLDQRLPLLTAGRRDTPQRHQTLRRTIAWSVDLLEDEAKRLFVRLAVFPGSFALDAAATIAGATTEDFNSLLEHSLVRRSQPGRFEMLATIRELASEMLGETNEADDLRRRHAEYFRAVALESRRKLHGPEQTRWLDRLEADHPNLRLALEWHLDQQPLVAAELAEAMAWFWQLRTFLAEGEAWVERALAAAPSAAAAVRASLIAAAGRLSYYRHHLDTAAQRLPTAVDLWRDGDDERGLAEALAYAGLAAGSVGDAAIARERCDEAVEVASRAGDPWTLGLALWALGANALLERCPAKSPSEPRELLERSVELLRAVGDPWALGAPLYYLGMIREEESGLIAAAPFYAEAGALFREVGDKYRLFAAVEKLLAVAQEEGDSVRAAALAAEVEALERDLGLER